MKYIYAICVGIVFFGVYLYTAAPSPGTGDCAELAAAGYTLGIAHAPGYPLYVLGGKVWTSLLPFGNPGYRMNIYSAVVAAVCLGFLYYVFASYTAAFFVPLCVVFLLGVMPGFWEAAIQSEVFVLNGLIAALVLGIMLVFPKENRVLLRSAAFLFGIGLGNQHTLLLLSPAIGIWMLFQWYQIFKSSGISAVIKEAGSVLLFFGIGISIYLFLPIRSRMQPLLDWEDPETWDRFWFVVKRLRYGSFQLAQGTPASLSFSVFIKQIKFFSILLFRNAGILGTGLIVCGLLTALMRIKNIKNLITLIAFICTGPGIFVLAHIDQTAGTEYIMNRFMLLCLIPAVFLIMLFLTTIKNRITANLLIAGLIIALIGVPERIYASFKQGVMKRHELFLRDFGSNILKHTPYQSYLLSDRADEFEFIIAYLLYAEEKRSDVHFIDCNASVSVNIYGTDYYRIWGKPRLAIREKREKALIAEARAPVLYGTLDPEQINIERVRDGMLYRVIAAPGREHNINWEYMLTEERGYDQNNVRMQHLQQSEQSQLAEYYLDVGFLHSAEKRIECLKAYGGEKSWGLIAGFWYYQRKMYLKAEMEYQKLLARFGDDAQVYNYLGVLYSDQKQYVRSCETLEKSIMLNPNDAKAQYNLAVAYWHLEKWEHAAQSFAEVLKREPDNRDAQIYYERARSRYGR